MTRPFTASLLTAWLVVSSLTPALLMAEATLQVGQGTAAPGETEVTVPISLELDPEEDPIEGLSMLIRYDPSVMGNVRVEDTQNADLFHYFDQIWYVEEGTVETLAFYVWDDFLNPQPLAESGVVANVRFCVHDTAVQGTYPIEVVPAATRRVGVAEATTVYTAGFESHTPVLSAGSLTVAGDAIQGESCPVDDRGPPPVPPPAPPGPYEASFELPEGSALPGGSVRLPFVVECNVEVHGLSFSVNFDETVLQATSVEEVFETPDGSEFDFSFYEIYNEDTDGVDNGVDAGFLLGAAVFTVFDHVPVVLPRDTENEVLAFHFDVLPDAPLGSTDVNFVDGAQGLGEPVPNIASAYGVSAELERVDSVLVINGMLQIVANIDEPDPAIRGNSNGDETVDLADAQYTLSFLFLGGPEPVSCFDIADANDDDMVDLSDPLTILNFLFLGTAEITSSRRPATALRPRASPKDVALRAEGELIGVNSPWLCHGEEGALRKPPGNYGTRGARAITRAPASRVSFLPGREET